MDIVKHIRSLFSSAIPEKRLDVQPHLDTQYHSQELFWERVKTYTVINWPAKPYQLSPLICARYGWENVRYNLLKCVTCKKIICANLPDPWDSYYHIALHKLEQQLTGNHEQFCAWKYNPSPETFCLLPFQKISSHSTKSSAPINGGHTQRNGILNEETFENGMIEYTREALDSLSELKTIPKISVITFYTITELQMLYAVVFEGINDLTNASKIVFTEREKNICILMLTGWVKRPKHGDIIECKYCQRHVGLWNFETIDFSSMTVETRKKINHINSPQDYFAQRERNLKKAFQPSSKNHEEILTTINSNLIEPLSNNLTKSTETIDLVCLSSPTTLDKKPVTFSKKRMRETEKFNEQNFITQENIIINNDNDEINPSKKCKKDEPKNNIIRPESISGVDIISLEVKHLLNDTLEFLSSNQEISSVETNLNVSNIQETILETVSTLPIIKNEITDEILFQESINSPAEPLNSNNIKVKETLESCEITLLNDTTESIVEISSSPPAQSLSLLLPSSSKHPYEMTSDIEISPLYTTSNVLSYNVPNLNDIIICCDSSQGSSTTQASLLMKGPNGPLKINTTQDYVNNSDTDNFAGKDFSERPGLIIEDSSMSSIDESFESSQQSFASPTSMTLTEKSKFEHLKSQVKETNNHKSHNNVMVENRNSNSDNNDDIICLDDDGDDSQNSLNSKTPQEQEYEMPESFSGTEGGGSETEIDEMLTEVGEDSDEEYSQDQFRGEECSSHAASQHSIIEFTDSHEQESSIGTIDMNQQDSGMPCVGKSNHDDESFIASRPFADLATKNFAVPKTINGNVVVHNDSIDLTTSPLHAEENMSLTTIKSRHAINGTSLNKTVEKSSKSLHDDLNKSINNIMVDESSLLPLDPLSQHRSWCPWVEQGKQNYYLYFRALVRHIKTHYA